MWIVPGMEVTTSNGKRGVVVNIREEWKYQPDFGYEIVVGTVLMLRIGNICEEWDFEHVKIVPQFVDPLSEG